MARERTTDRVTSTTSIAFPTDLLESNLKQFPAPAREQLTAWLESGNEQAVNAFIEQVRAKSPVLEWGIQQGQHITGTQTSYAFLQQVRLYQTATVSANVTQDVLLLAGAEDHYVPVQQFYDQIATLTNTRSLTARLFTRHEQEQNHVQVGNFGLAFQTIIDWIESLRMRDEKLTIRS